MFEARIGDADEFRLPDLTDAVVADLKGDQDLYQAFIEQQVRSMVYEVGSSMLASWRAAKMKDGQEVIAIGAVSVTRRVIERRAQSRRLAWLQHYEQVGDRHVQLMAMTKQDCAVAADERGRRAAAEGHYERFLRQVGSRLLADERVQDKFAVDDLQRIFDECLTAKTAPRRGRSIKTA